MSERKLSRRQVLKALGIGAAGVTLAACQPQVVEKVVEKEVTREVEVKAAPKKPVTVRFMCRAGEQGQQQRIFADQWNEMHPEIQIKKEEAAWGDLATKVEAQAATGTLADLVFQVIWWFPYLAHKGVWLALDDLIAANDPGMDDFFPWAIEVCTWGGKIRALPGAVHPGKANLVYNKTLLEEKGVPLPTLDWTWDDWTQAALDVTDRDKGIWGTVGAIGATETDANNFRYFDGNIFNYEGTKMELDTENTLECLKLQRDRIVEMHVSPLAEEMTSSAKENFMTGIIGLLQNNIDAVGFAEAIGDKFEWGIMILPKGPRGTRGSMAFANQFVIYSKSKVPQETFAFLSFLTGPTGAKWLPLMIGKQPMGRKSAWEDPEVLKKWPHYGLINEHIFSKGVKPFPMPANTRFLEFEDTYTNEIRGIYQGNQTIEDQLPVVIEKCQKVLDLPLP